MLDLLAVLIVFSLLVSLLFVAHKGVKIFKLSAEISRKSVHILMGLTVLAFPYIFHEPWSVWLLALLSLTLFYTLRHYKRARENLGDALYRIERKSYGEIYYTLAIALTFTLSPNQESYMAAILTLTFSDALASLIGVRYGRYFVSLMGNKKSFEGSSAFFITTLLILILITQNVPLALTLALLLTLVELLSIKGIDNVLIPLATLGLLALLQGQSTLFLLGISLLVTLLLYALFRRYHTYDIEEVDNKITLTKHAKVQASLTHFNNSYFGDLKAENADSLKALLTYVKQQHTHLVGPINGSTWHSYRVMTYSDGSTPFILEPQNPSFYPEVLEAAGFKAIDQYFSSKVALHSAQDSRIQRVKERLEAHGIHIRYINLDAFEDELKMLHTLSHQAFGSNPHYSEISQEAFIELYLPFKDVIAPELCQLVFLKEELIGYMFALIDKQRLIIKTTAFTPLKASAGTSLVLMDNFARFALQQGCHELVYALMHEDNHSAKTANKNATIFRRYALYEWHLS